MTNGAPSIHTTEGKLHELRRRMTEAGIRSVEERMTSTDIDLPLSARDRVEYLLDDHSFVETDLLAKSRSHAYELAAVKPVGDGVVTGYGTIDGRSVCVFSVDSSVMNGTVGEVTGEKIIKVMDLALKTGRPLISILDGEGARLQEGINALAAYGEVFQRIVKLSGLVPQISIVLGECYGGNAFVSALQDFVIMVKGQSRILYGTPRSVAERAGDRSTEELGGAETCLTQTGLCHYAADDERDALDYAKDVLSYLPSNNRATAPATPAYKLPPDVYPSDPELDAFLPDNDAFIYDMNDILAHIVDTDTLLPVQAGRADNIITAFARLEGRSVGIVANQPNVLSGALTSAAAEKAARFIRTCDAFNVPVITLVDVPGFLPSAEEEMSGAVRSGSKLFYAYAEATAPKVTVVVRRAIGEAYNAMGSKHLGTDMNLAWATASIAVEHPDNAIQVLHKKELDEAQEKGDEAVKELSASLSDQYAQQVLSPYVAAERGFVDSVIMPGATRYELCQALRLLERKVVTEHPKRHGNIPL